MPLVEIDLLEGRSEAELDAISDAIHEAMVAVLDVPQRDRFQLVTERRPGYLRFDPNYLDIDRDEGFLLIRITLSAGRTTAAKQAFYRLLAELLAERTGDANREPRGGPARERARGLVLRPRAGELPRASARRVAMRWAESGWRIVASAWSLR
jgi:4-oxalocrotonate tautomerase